MDLMDVHLFLIYKQKRRKLDSIELFVHSGGKIFMHPMQGMHICQSQ
jgi:hypothetical protein